MGEAAHAPAAAQNRRNLLRSKAPPRRQAEPLPMPGVPRVPPLRIKVEVGPHRPEELRDLHRESEVALVLQDLDARAGALGGPEASARQPELHRDRRGLLEELNKLEVD